MRRLRGRPNAHIHRGSCENLDPQPEYPLENVVDGKSTTEVNVAVEDLVDKGFAIADVDRRYSCPECGHEHEGPPALKRPT